MTLTNKYHYWYSCLVIICICCFAITAFWWRDATRIAEGLVILLSIGMIREIYLTERQRSVLWFYGLAFIFIVFMYITNAYAESIYTEIKLNHDRFARFYTKLFLFLLVGWWLIDRPVAAQFVLGAFVIGVLVTILQSDIISRWPTISFNSRLDLGFSNAQHAGLCAGSLLVMSTALLPYSFCYSDKVKAVAALCVLLLLFALGLWMTILTKTRGAWLGICIAIPVIVLSWLSFFEYFKRNKRRLIIAVMLFCSAVFWGVYQIDLVKKRMTAEADYYTDLVAGKYRKSQLGSVGTRVMQWRLGIELIAENPLLGYGGATKEWLIQQSDIPDAARRSFGHFHNSYIELAVAYGLGACAVFISILGLLAWRCWQSLKQATPLARAIGFTGLAWVIFFAIANIFESYVMFRSGYILLAILGGIIYGLTSPNPGPTLNSTKER